MTIGVVFKFILSTVIFGLYSYPGASILVPLTTLTVNFLSLYIIWLVLRDNERRVREDKPSEEYTKYNTLSDKDVAIVLFLSLLLFIPGVHVLPMAFICMIISYYHRRIYEKLWCREDC